MALDEVVAVADVEAAGGQGLQDVDEKQPRVVGGGKGSRTPDLLNAIQALYQLSYTPNNNP